ncbi:MAG: 23S rRNA (adenine(2503)-C(2))-methyltransferase RlmN [Clostridia bacterium]|nr:23S rRNA (adenine(2503)-C(2))-methyltransferase RlmN [Clostridia bacterium]
MTRIDIKSLPDSELTALLKDWNVPAFRAKQIRNWLDNGVSSFAEMNNLPLSLRKQLEEHCRIPSVKILRRLVSAIDETTKYLFELEDGHTVESVLMKYKHGWSQCLSTQVGCRMGCSFCATGIDGLARDLLPSEMIAQIEAAEADRGIRVSSIVLMGMGEPLDNYANVLRFLEMLETEGGVHIGMRHISLSTCGLVNRIYDLAERNLQITLSISLHAPNNELRRRLMPVARKWTVEELLAACKAYTDKTGRRISYEYAMIDGVNDTDACAHELVRRLKGTLCHVNLIPANSVAGKDQKRSSKTRLKAFVDILTAGGLNATVRRTLGSDINASCGQLRRQQEHGVEQIVSE